MWYWPPQCYAIWPDSHSALLHSNTLLCLICPRSDSPCFAIRWGVLLLTLQWHGRSQAPAAKKVAVAETPRDDVMDLTHKYDAVEAEIKRATSSKEAVDELFQVVGGGYKLNLLSPPHPLLNSAPLPVYKPRGCTYTCFCFCSKWIRTAMAKRHSQN